LKGRLRYTRRLLNGVCAMSEEEKVKCKYCGLLAVRTNESELQEAHETLRDEGALSQNLHNGQILCIVKAFDLKTEIAEQPNNTNSTKRILPVLEKDRECKKFRDWVQGFSPKEHLQMILSENMVIEAEKRRAADEERAKEQRKADKDWQKEQREEDIKRLRAERWGDRIYQIIIGIIAFVGTILGGHYLNSILERIK